MLDFWHDPLVHTNTPLSVVVPVYRSSATLEELAERIAKSVGPDSLDLILVDDSSADGTWATITLLSNKYDWVRGIRLGRNSGQHAALLAGVRAASNPIIVTIDDDLQNPPEEIMKLVNSLQESGADVVYGVPNDPAHAGWRKGSGWLVRKSMKAVLGVDEVVNMSSFRAFRTDLRNAFDVRLGPGVSLDALLSWGGSDFRAVEVDHHSRQEGKSHYSLKKLWRFAIDTITGYTTVPLQAVSALGFLTAIIGIFLMIGFVLVPFVRGISVQGFPFLASTIILFSGIQLITLGVVSEYLAKMHFRIMNKPEYVVAEETK
jgi:undecaprenyl-phosphate 4-deoxy-4-formamido-L-arabinose transferase